MTREGDLYTITLHDPVNDTDDEVAERNEFNNALTAEVLPDEPPTPLDQAIAMTRAMPERHQRWSFRARDAQGNLVGSASTRIDPDHDDNPEVLFAGVNVVAEHRRNGLGSQLLNELIAVAQAEGRTRLVGHTIDTIEAGLAFAREVGADAKQALHLNHLVLADVDRPMLERWVAEGPVRADDYELIGWDGSVPDEHMADWLDLVLVMNTAPRDALEVNDFTLTEQEIRESEKVSEAAGYAPWALVARRKSDGAWAGFHDVTYDPTNEQVVWVGATGVRPEHRGHALGKWLKAAMTLRVFDERPTVTEIRTGNADSNDAMLGINKEMGYKPLIAQTTWELSVDAAEAWVRKRGLTRD
jgi:GNAT superfamily N-acetyltransferase